jgi:hypothetical protein
VLGWKEQAARTACQVCLANHVKIYILKPGSPSHMRAIQPMVRKILPRAPLPPSKRISNLNSRSSKMVLPHLLFQPRPPLDRQHLDCPEKGRHGGVLEAAVRGAQRPAHGVRVQDEVPRDDCRQNQGVVHGRHMVADSDQGLALGPLADCMDQLLSPVDLLSRVT